MRILRVALRRLGSTAAAVVSVYVLWIALSTFVPNANIARIAWIALIFAGLATVSWLDGGSNAPPLTSDREDDSVGEKQN
jgi:drug/metabolite transporter (DMT)-like permease